MENILDQVKSQILNQMTPDQIKEALAQSIAEARERQARQKEYNAKPENREKRKAYSKEYQEKVKQNPELAAKRDAARKAYNAKPEVKEKRKAYQQERNNRHKALLAAARELGMDVDAIVAKASQQPSA